ncbi:MAG: selenocysteine-specific translation elongation factor, partial [Clostridium sp.]|uniref:selenocysteine-specific translation elongation factor n=1 Tax=Clostridium sp. TaxID=1506 RepID=UPI003F35B65F
GINAGIIDVPGHEKFVKNMVSGASSIDMVLFVISADDGIMPQTKEHFNILKILGIKRGIIVLTKCDLVDEEWISLVKEEIKEFVKGSFLENAQIIEFSNKNNKGVDLLKQKIEEAIAEIEEKDSESLFRLPIDRVFTASGFGTIVTGTMIGGKVKVGDSLEIYPKGIKCKVRGIQVHGKDVEEAFAGERTAINLNNVQVADIEKGDILGEEDKEVKSFMIDIKFEYLSSQKRKLENRTRVRIHHGTKEVLGRIIILNKEFLENGENAYCQIRLEEELSTRRKDKVVIRSYSPIETIGGGVILNENPKKAKRFKEDYINELVISEKGSLEENIVRILKKEKNLISKLEISNKLNKDEMEIEMALDKMISKKLGIKIIDKYCSNLFLKEKEEVLIDILNEYYKANPLKEAMKKEEVKSKLFKEKIKKLYFEEILKSFEKKNIIEISEENIKLKDYKIKFTLKQKQLIQKIMEIYLNDGFKTKRIKEVLENEADKLEMNKIINYLVDKGDIILLSEDVVYSKEYLEQAIAIVKKYLSENTYIDLKALKELIDIPRKYLIAILEYCDFIKLTYRDEKGRRLL